jgi:flagellar biosynthesis protein FliQ
MWHGGYAWGPRFLVPVIPLLCVTLAPLIDTCRGTARWAFRALFGLSAAIQLLACTVDFSLHQEALLETGIPLFDPVTFFDPRYSQLWGTLSFLKPENLDFAWIESKPAVHVDVLAVTTAVLLVALCTFGLVVALRQAAPSRQRQALVLVVLPLLVAAGTALSLAWYKDGNGDYVHMLEFLELNSQAGDAIIQNSPTQTALFQNQYKGRLAAYGTFEGEQPLSPDTVALLEKLASTHPRIWLIPEGLPPQLSSLDRWFSDESWSPSHHSFGDERLTLYSRP